MSEIKKDDYYLFLKLFEYNYAYEYAPISFIHMIKEYSDHLKKEILSNFINLNRDEKIAYLDWLKFDIDKLLNNVWSTKEHLEKWYLKYNVPADFVFKVEYSSNKLYQFLQSDRPTFKETFEPDFNPDLVSSMDDFYNYYYGQGIIDMLSFIEEQENKLQASDHLLSTSQIINDNTASNETQLKEAYLNKFLKFYDNIELPTQSTVYYYHDIWASYFLNLKSEIQSNIIKLPKEDRIIYLESIFNKIKSRTLYFGYLETDIRKWYEKYNITEQLLFGSNKQENELYHIIRSWPPDFDQTSLSNYTNDTEDIQNDFYNYIMLRNANEVSNFLKLQISIIEQPLSLADKNNEPIKVEFENITDIFDYINEGILQIELFIKGSITEIKFYSLSDAFHKLLQEIIKIENFTDSNIGLIYQYNNILYDIKIFDEDREYDDNIEIDNKFFRSMIIQVFRSLDLIDIFLNKHNLNPEQITHKNSILDIILDKNDSKVPKQPKRKNTIPVAYSYKNYNQNFSALSDTLNGLKKNEFVAQDTDLKDFRKIFNNTSPTKPLTWKGNISELTYFIKLLHNDFKLITDLKGNIWKVTSKLFVDADGNPFESKRFRGQKNPAKANLLEKALEHLK